MKKICGAYRTVTFFDCIKTPLSKLSKQHTNPLSILKMQWIIMAPEWAHAAQPCMIRNKVLIMKAGAQAMILQYRERELLDIARVITNGQIMSIKIID
jgi:hypothetical protein